MNAVTANTTTTSAEHQHIWLSMLQQLAAASRDIVSQHKVTPKQYRTLLAIRTWKGEGPMSIGALSVVIGICHNATVELVNKLQRRGLVDRKRAKRDGRVSELTLTDEGLRVVDELAVAHDRDLRRLAPKAHDSIA